jgi:uncharacterized RDD family membrane protein YckC
VEARRRADHDHWRQEVISRVRQHRARRRRHDPNALEFDFPDDAPLMIASAVAEPPVAESNAAEPLVSERPLYDAELAPPIYKETVSEEKIYEETIHQETVCEDKIYEGKIYEETLAPTPAHYEPITLTPPAFPREARPEPRKIIRFPRQIAFDVEAELAELAAPPPETPRILDAPEAEQLELLPSFADIRLEESPNEDLFPQDLELPSEPAPLQVRLMSGLVDAAIVFLALVLFAGVFNALLGQFTAPAPKARPALLFGVAAASALWLLFQYLFLVHGRKTPGMGATGLELSTFEGRRPSYLGCCSRALGATLSGLSLGLGFFWALVDEHTLGWHDRISQTYLKTSN